MGPLVNKLKKAEIVLLGLGKMMELFTTKEKTRLTKYSTTKDSAYKKTFLNVLLLIIE